MSYFLGAATSRPRITGGRPVDVYSWDCSRALWYLRWQRCGVCEAKGQTKGKRKSADFTGEATAAAEYNGSENDEPYLLQSSAVNWLCC
jgi:hypothetical protein